MRIDGAAGIAGAASREIVIGLGVALTSIVLVFVFFDQVLQFQRTQFIKSTLAPDAPHYPQLLFTSNGLSLSEEVRHTEGDQDEIRLRLHPGLVFENVPEQHARRFRINGAGFRGAETSSVPSVPRILLLGGSSAFGTGVSADEDTLPAKLQPLVGGAEIINAGVVGYESGQELAFLIGRGVDYKPSLVMTFDGFNDFVIPLHQPRPAYGLGFSAFEQVEDQLARLDELTRGPLPVRAVKSFANALFPLAARRLGLLRDETRPTSSPIVDVVELADAYADNVIKMSVVSRAFGASFLAVIQPQIDNDPPIPGYWADPSKAYAAFAERTVERLRSANVLVEDLHASAGFLSRDKFLDMIHLNGKGHQVVAERLAGRIRERNLLQAEAPGAGGR